MPKGMAQEGGDVKPSDAAGDGGAEDPTTTTVDDGAGNVAGGLGERVGSDNADGGGDDD